jgi:hypothetical protein
MLYHSREHAVILSIRVSVVDTPSSLENEVLCRGGAVSTTLRLPDRRCLGMRRIKWALVESSLLANMTQSPIWSCAADVSPSKLFSDFDVKPDTVRSIGRRRVTEVRELVPALLIVFELCCELCCERRHSLLFSLERGVLLPDKLLNDRLSRELDKVELRCGSLLVGIEAALDDLLEDPSLVTSLVH